MKYLRFFPAIVIASGLSCVGLADTLTLKSGEVIEGKISVENDTQLTVELKLSGGITDSRTILKSDILSIAKIQPDQLAWEPLKNLKPGPTSLPAASYAPAIQSLQSFLQQFASSAFAAEAQKSLTAFEQEKARVDGGELKINDQWLAKEEAQRERYQIAAAMSFQFMKDQTIRGDLSGALSTFDGIEKQYPGSRIYPDAVELARRALTAFQPDLVSRIQSIRAAEAERDKAFQTSSPAQKAELKAAIERERATEAALMSEAQRRNSKWPPLIARSEKSLTATATKIPEEIRRLAGIDVAKMRQSLKAADQSKAAFSTNDHAAALDLIKEALSVWPANELATRLQEEIKAGQATAIAVAAEAAEEQKKLAAEEQKRIEAEEKEKAAQAEQAAQAAAAAARAATEAASQKIAVPVPEKKPFLLTATGASCIVALLALAGAGLAAYRKLKGRAPESID
jgi:hypothetical protein